MLQFSMAVYPRCVAGRRQSPPEYSPDDDDWPYPNEPPFSNEFCSTVTLSNGQDYEEITPTIAPVTTTCEPTTTTCEPETTTPKPTTTRTTTPKPTTTTRTTTPKPTTKPPPTWKAGVDEYVTKCRSALKFFVGKTYNTANTILNAFLCFIPKVQSAADDISPIISTEATKILNAISNLSGVGRTPRGILLGLKNALPQLQIDYINIVNDLGADLGVDVSLITDAITDLANSFFKVIAQYENGDCNVDYEAVLKSVQTLTNSVSSVSNEALEGHENDANVRDALYVLAFLYDHCVIKAHAVNVSLAAELNIRCGSISQPWSQCLNVLDKLLTGLTKALLAVVTTAVKAVVALVKAIADLAKSLNDVLKSVFNIVQDVTDNLTDTVSNTLLGVGDGLTNILGLGK